MIAQENITKQEKVQKKCENDRIFLNSLKLQFNLTKLYKKKKTLYFFLIRSSYLPSMFFSHADIANKTGTSNSTVKRAIDLLCGMGLMTKARRDLPSKIVDGLTYQTTNLYKMTITVAERYKLYEMFKIFFCSISLAMSASTRNYEKNELPIIVKGNKSYIYSQSLTDSNTVFGHNYQLLQKEWKKMEDDRYEDQPWFDKELKNQKEIRKKNYFEQNKLTSFHRISTEEPQKTESRKLFIPPSLPEPEEVAENKRGAIDLFAKPGQLIAGASIFASILAHGKGFNESFD